MAAVDQSTRRGRLIVVFIGGLIIFSGLMLGGLYLSHQRKIQFETAQNGDNTQITDEETEDSAEIAGEPTDDDASDSEGEASQGSSEGGETAADEEVTQEEEDVDTVAVTGPSGDANDEEVSEEGIPATGPSDASGEGSPTEIPATGPEIVWIIAIIGAMAAAYAGFEYRRSRLAFLRAAMQRD